MIGHVAAQKWFPIVIQANFTTASIYNPSNVSDPAYDAMHEAAGAATTLEEQNRISREMNQYAIEKFWAIWGGLAPGYLAIQPWVIGFNGEMKLGNAQYNTVLTRLWIDSELKKEMGH